MLAVASEAGSVLAAPMLSRSRPPSRPRRHTHARPDSTGQTHDLRRARWAGRGGAPSLLLREKTSIC